MAESAGGDTGAVLLRALPAELVGAVLDRLPADAADILREKVSAFGGVPPAPEEVDAALTAFFDLLRIAERPVPAVGDARPVPGQVLQSPSEPVAPSAVEELRALSPERLARVLDGEQPAAVALILGQMSADTAGTVFKRLKPELRTEVAVRLSRPSVRNPALVEQLVRAAADRVRRLKDVPAEPTLEERVHALADMLRAVPRAERGPVLQRLEAADPESAALVRDKLYRIEDLLRVPDRQLQGILAEIDVKKLALALKEADPAVRTKVSGNMSTRAKTVLAEESEMLGDVPASTVKTARSDVLALLRRFEDEGRVTIEE